MYTTMNYSNLENNFKTYPKNNIRVDEFVHSHLSKHKLEILIKKYIMLYTYKMDYTHLYNIIDHCIILSDNDIKLDSFYENNNNYPENDNNYPEMIQEYYF